MNRGRAFFRMFPAVGFVWLGLSVPGFAAEGAPASAPSYFPAPSGAAPCAHYAGSVGSDVKWGTERSLGSGSAFVPLACHSDTLLFADLRFKMDGDHNREGNAGLGMRFLTGGDGIFGTYAFYDRKRSDGTGKWHTQGTVGAEWLAEHWELRANGYLPLTKKKTVTTGPSAGLAVSAPHLAGSGIYVTETLQQLLEERPMRGVDIEAGGEHPAIPGLWLHAGGFSFKAHGGASLTGYRGRASYDLTDNVALTAEGQWDDERGRQAWLGARFSLAFGGPSEPATGLKARMTNLPVRDVDIVTSGKVVGQATQEQPVLNAETGETQRVLYVDNTAPDGGDGSLDHPFNTLLAAQAALRDHDVVYLAHGDGTTTGQNAGFTINKPDVQFIGEGSAFVYDGTSFAAASGDFTGTVLKAAGDAPIITNGAGSGVTVTGDEAFLAGFTVDGATADGIYILNASATVDNVTVRNNTGRGIYMNTNAAGEEQSFTARGVTAEGNGGSGVAAVVSGVGSVISEAFFSDVETRNNGIHGLCVFAMAGGQVGSVDILDVTAEGNTIQGVYAYANGLVSTISEVSFSDVVTRDNGGYGLLAHALLGGRIGSADILNATAEGNTQYGVSAHAEGAGSIISEASFSDIVTRGNGNHGLFVYALSGGQIGSADISSVTAEGNALVGVYARAEGAGAFIGNASLSDVVTQNNGASGLHLLAISGGQIGNAVILDTTAEENATYGVLVQANSAGSVIDSVSFYGLVTRGNGYNGPGYNGLNVLAVSSGQIGSVDVSNLTTEENITNGVHIQATGAGSLIESVSFSDVVTQNNGASGFYIYAESGGWIDGADVFDVTADGNSTTGFYIFANGVSVLDNVSIESSTAVGNGTNGVFVNDDTTGTFVVDLGGGTLGSAGGNRIYDNTGTDIRVDLDGGQLSAQNNWWGDPAGLQAGERTLEVGSTIDASNFLTEDPGP